MRDRTEIAHDVSDRVSLLQNRLSGKSKHIGAPGHAIPDLADLVCMDFADLPSIANITLIGSPARGNNYAWIAPSFVTPATLRISVGRETRDCLLIIGTGSRLFGRVSFQGSGHTAIFSGKDVSASANTVELNGSTNLFYLGAASSSNGLISHVVGKDVSICIGEDLLCAHDVRILTSDMHALVDATTGGWINRPENVYVAPHVWLADRSIMLKGSSIGFGSILAMGAILTSHIGTKCAAAGSPARVVRENVTWHHTLMPSEKSSKELLELEERIANALT